jgi:hypothetical protein
MRIRILIGVCAILGVFAVTTSSAQSRAGATTGGVKGGVNLSTVTGSIDVGIEKSIHVGGVFGGFVTVPFSDMLAFQPEFLYSMDGVKLKGTSGGNLGFEGKANVDFVRIPLLLRIGPTARGSKGGYFLVGPSIDFVTRAKVVTTSPSGVPDDDIKDTFKSVVTSVVIAGGYSAGRGLIEARYTAGVQNLEDPAKDSSKNKAQTFSILVGVGF